MTLVVCNLTFICFSFSAPVENTNIQTKKNLIQHEQKTSPSLRPEKSDSTSDEAPQFFFSYEESFTIRASVGLNFKELKKTEGDKDPWLVLGMRYMLPNTTAHHQEYGLDLATDDNSRLYVSGGYKHILDRTENLRPYFKIGAAIRFDEGDKLETPFDFKSWSLVGSMGIEDLIKDPHSLRADLDLFWGKEDFLALISFGWSIAF